MGIFFHSFPMAEHLLCRLSLFAAGRTAKLLKSYLKTSKHPLTKTDAEPLERVSVDSKILFVS